MIYFIVFSTRIVAKKNSTVYETSPYSSEVVEFFIKYGKVNVSPFVNSNCLKVFKVLSNYF